MVLLRRLLGEVLRGHRTLQGRTLRDVSTAAGVSLGYLSEIERGRKEASSELLAAICDALSLSLADVLREVSDQLVREERRPVLTPIGFSNSSRLAHPVVGTRQVAGVPPLRTTRPTPAHRPVGPVHHRDRPPTRPVSPAAPVAMTSLSSTLHAPATGVARVPLAVA